MLTKIRALLLILAGYQEAVLGHIFSSVFSVGAPQKVFVGFMFGVLLLVCQPSSAQACARDYKMCADNKQMMNNWDGRFDVQFACETAVNKMAKYGDPDWPFVRFGTFLKGEDYPKTGKVTVFEDEVKLQNGFGVYARQFVRCVYDIEAKEVIDLSFE